MFFRTISQKMRDWFRADYRVIGIVFWRNVEAYLEQFFRYNLAEGVMLYGINHGSEDNSRAIAERYLNKGLLHIEDYPFDGYYRHADLMQRKKEIAAELDADWFVHYDSDEILQAPRPYATLYDGLHAVSQLGYNSVNFNEFVFLPIDGCDYVGTDFVQRMRQYYFFEPYPHHRRKAWRNLPTELHIGAGHQINFAGQRIYPHNFIMRHYMCLNQQQALGKYLNRHYPPAELARGWHGSRATFAADKLDLQPKPYFRVLGDDAIFDVSQPIKKHEFLG